MLMKHRLKEIEGMRKNRLSSVVAACYTFDIGKCLSVAVIEKKESRFYDDP